MKTVLVLWTLYNVLGDPLRTRDTWYTLCEPLNCLY